MGDNMRIRSNKNFIEMLREKRLKYLKSYLEWKQEETELKSSLQMKTHSMLWVWEFSKKAVLICLFFYIVVQIYSMIVMVVSGDFTHLGELITKTGEIVENCVFGYFIKSGFENLIKLYYSHKSKGYTEDDISDNSDEPVG